MPNERLTDYQAAFQSGGDLASYFKAHGLYEVKWNVIERYNARLYDMFYKLNSVIVNEYRKSDTEMAAFKRCINRAYRTLRNTRIIEDKFHNNGRAPEDVYYNWMRGYLVCLYFKKMIAEIFGVKEKAIQQFGADSLDVLRKTQDPAKFKKDAAADFKISADHLATATNDILIEVQSGFTGINDIKKTKANEAKKKYDKNQTQTFVAHFDLFNGRLAVFEITHLADTDGWIKNTQLNGALTKTIPDDCFVWSFMDHFPSDVSSIIKQLI